MFKEPRSHTRRLAALCGFTACVLLAAANIASAAPIGAYTTKGAWSFVSEPGLHPPKLGVLRPTVSNKLARGWFLVANFPNLTATEPPPGTQAKTLVGQSGPLILDRNLQPIWFAPTNTNVLASNLEEQRFNGQPALSWWQGVVTNVGATVSGRYVVVNQHYHKVAQLTGADGWVLSLHDFVISGGNAWVTAYKVLRNINLSAEGGSPAGTLLDVAAQEYNLKTGQLIYNWDAYNPGGTPNIPLSASEQPPPANPNQPWDAYHINSIQLAGNGTFLTSMRNTWAAYLVRKNTNQVLWTLGGKASSFTFGPDAAFEWQHDVELRRGNVLTVFDDHCCTILGGGTFAKPTGPSRGLTLQLDTTKHTATLIHQYTRGKSFNAAFLGNTDLLPGGNVLVGWGSTPFFTEYSNSGQVLLDALWPGPDLSYRAVFSGDWVGLPSYPPSGGARNKKGKATVYASWDGATKVVAWRVLAGSDAKHLSVVVKRARKSGFETAVRLTRTYSKYKVQALDAKGRVLGTSRSFSAPKPGSSPQGPPSGPGGY